MKILVIGLGSFGSTLASELTLMGHEVMGVDKDEKKAEILKDKINYIISTDCTNDFALSEIPLSDFDFTIVSIGEDIAGSILTSSLLIKNNVSNLYCRSVSDIHTAILESIGVKNILFPEQSTAKTFAKSISNSLIINSYIISDEYLVSEININNSFIGLKVAKLIESLPNDVQLLLIKKKTNKKNLLGRLIEFYTEILPQDANIILESEDKMVVFGKSTSIIKFCKSM